jgi:hypothetical protein
MSTPNSQGVRVSRVSIGRVFNLGNYEHVRYEVELQIQEGCDSAGPFQDLMDLIEDLNPRTGFSEGSIAEAQRIVNMPPDKVPQWERENIGVYQARLAEHAKAQQRRVYALQVIDQLGGNVRYADAKENWDNDDQH